MKLTNLVRITFKWHYNLLLGFCCFCFVTVECRDNILLFKLTWNLWEEKNHACIWELQNLKHHPFSGRPYKKNLMAGQIRNILAFFAIFI